MSCIVPNCQQAKLSNDKLSLHLFPDPTRDPKRHLVWIKTINSEKVYKFDPTVVFKRFRVCRNHFTKDCFNGECKKLLPTAVPTLHLGISSKPKAKFYEYEAKILNLLKKNSVNVDEDTLKLDLDDIYTTVEEDKSWGATDKDSSISSKEEFLLIEVENNSNNQSQFTIVMPENPIQKAPPKVLNYNNRKLAIQVSPPDENLPAPLTNDRISQLQKNFNKNPKNKLTEHICTHMSIFNVCHTNDLENFNQVIDLNVPENSQSNHWSYPFFLILRHHLVNKLNFLHFEFSQLHFVYYQKLEKCYRLLIELSKGEKDPKNLLDEPLTNGGRWDLFTNIISKYGVFWNRKNLLEKNNTDNIENIDSILKSKLREYFKILSDSKCNTKQLIESQVSEICSILNLCLGTPSQSIWLSDDETETAITPLKMFEDYLKDYVDEKCCIITDPRPTLGFQKLFTTESPEIIEGNKPLYNNQPADVLMDAIGNSITNKELVLAVCASNGINSFKLRNFHLLCDVKINSTLHKSTRLETGDYFDKRILIVTAVSFNSNGKPENFRMESFQNGRKETIVIPKEYFGDIVLEIIISKCFLSKEVKRLFDTKNAGVLNSDDPILSYIKN